MGEQREELLLELAERDPVLRPLGTGDRRLDGGEVDVEHGRVVALAARGHPEQPLGLEVAAHGLDVLVAPAGRLEIAAGLLVDREEADRRAVLGRHVPERGAVRHRQAGGALAVKLDELADDARLPQELGDAQDQVGRGHALAQPAVEVHADHVGQEEIDRLAEHRRLRLDPADSPADDSEPVDHRRVRVGADQRVGIQHAVLLEHAARQELEVHLVADAEPRRHDPQAVECLRSPT